MKKILIMFFIFCLMGNTAYTENRFKQNYSNGYVISNLAIQLFQRISSGQQPDYKMYANMGAYYTWQSIPGNKLPYPNRGVNYIQNPQTVINPTSILSQTQKTYYDYHILKEVSYNPKNEIPGNNININNYHNNMVNSQQPNNYDTIIRQLNTSTNPADYYRDVVKNR